MQKKTLCIIGTMLLVLALIFCAGCTSSSTQNSQTVQTPSTIVEQTPIEEPTIIEISSITISGISSLKVGESTTLTATIKPTDATNKTLDWKSDNTNIAKVDSNGKVNGVSSGTATITACATDGSGVKATKTITVKKVEQSTQSSSTTYYVHTDSKIVHKAGCSKIGKSSNYFTVTDPTPYKKCSYCFK